MKNRTVSLQTRLMATTIGLIIISIALSTILVSNFEIRSMESKIETNLMNTGIAIASTPLIQRELANKNSDALQEYVGRLLNSLSDTEIITIADMSGLRYAHPNSDRVGEYFVGGDEEVVLKEGKSYISQAVGTLGRSVRAFVPIYYEGKQVGFVMTGHLYNEVIETKNNAYRSFLIYSFVGIIAGSIGAFALSLYIKRVLHGLEPEEIGRLYSEKDAMLASMKEGILAIDENGIITEINYSALRIINANVDKEEIIGKNIMDVFPETLLLTVVEKKKRMYNLERTFNGTPIVSNFSPIIIDGEVKGAIATFNDRTKVVKMAEEITGVKQIVDALRANTHEFLNKLHLIHGLLELGKPEEAKKFILETSTGLVEVQDVVLKNISNSTINALLIGKYNRAKELRISFKVDESSFLGMGSANIANESIVTILGNLIENSMDSIAKTENRTGDINVYICDLNDFLIIRVTDTGIGIPKGLSIFDRGVTTKEGSGGTGLYLVNKHVQIYGGTITHKTLNGLTTFEAIIPLGGTK